MGYLLLGSSYNYNAQKCSPFKESLFNVFAAPHSQGQRYIQLALPIRHWQLGPKLTQRQYNHRQDSINTLPLLFLDTQYSSTTLLILSRYSSLTLRYLLILSIHSQYFPRNFPMLFWNSTRILLVGLSQYSQLSYNYLSILFLKSPGILLGTFPILYQDSQYSFRTLSILSQDTQNTPQVSPNTFPILLIIF